MVTWSGGNEIKHQASSKQILSLFNSNNIKKKFRFGAFDRTV